MKQLANPQLVDEIEQLVNQFKAYSDTKPGEAKLRAEQRLLEFKIAELEQDAKLPAKTKAGLMMDRIVDYRGLERKLKDLDTPVEFFYMVFNNQMTDVKGDPVDVPLEYRVKAATAAARYVHRAMPAQVEVTGKDGGAIEVVHSAREKLTAVLFDNDILDAEIIDEENKDA